VRIELRDQSNLPQRAPFGGVARDIAATRGTIGQGAESVKQKVTRKKRGERLPSLASFVAGSEKHRNWPSSPTARTLDLAVYAPAVVGAKMLNYIKPPSAVG
jgi:hypothetical protein